MITRANRLRPGIWNEVSRTLKTRGTEDAIIRSEEQLVNKMMVVPGTNRVRCFLKIPDVMLGILLVLMVAQCTKRVRWILAVPDVTLAILDLMEQRNSRDPDGMHPSTEVYQEFADLILPRVKQLL
jgi:hypothetical protein